MLRLHRITLGSAAALIFSASPEAQAFSLGVRAGGGLEVLTLTGIKFFRADGDDQIKTDDDIQRTPLHFGADLVVTPVNFGNLGVSGLIGFRSTTAKVKGQFNDERLFNYLPVGASVDYTLGSFRLSASTLYDLAMSPKLIISSDETSTSADLEVKGLSRLRFGAVGEYFLLKNLSFFAGGDFVTGSFDNGVGQIAIKDGEKVVELAVSSAKNKISGFSFAAGIAYTYSLAKSDDANVSNKAKKQGKKVRKKTKRKRKNK